MTISTDEILPNRTQALLEGRIVYDPTGMGEYIDTVPDVAKEWNKILATPKMQDASRHRRYLIHRNDTLNMFVVLIFIRINQKLTSKSM
jgi:hypothetical protein